jgi:AcrR family transcriptional regulator
MLDQNLSVVSLQPQIPEPAADAQNPSAQPAAIPAPALSPEPSASVAGLAALPEPIDHTSRDEEIILNAPGELGELITGDNMPNLIHELPSRLHLAFLYIQRGYGVRKIAELMNVSRGTIYYWINNDPRLIAALRKWRALNNTETDTRMAAMLTPSLDGLENAVAHGSLTAMLAVIKHNTKRRIGATDEKVISARLARRKKRHAAEVNPPAASSAPPCITSEANPTDDPKNFLVDDSTITTPPYDHPCDMARLAVKNTSDRRIIADLTWDGEYGPFQMRRVVLFARATTDIGSTLNVKRGIPLTMIVDEARYKN